MKADVAIFDLNATVNATVPVKYVYDYDNSPHAEFINQTILSVRGISDFNK